MIGTPCYDGNVSVEYLHALIGTIALGSAQDVQVLPVHVSFDALIQRARNDLFRYAVESDVTDLVFIDADQAWVPMDVFRLLGHPVDVVGAAVPKKSLTAPDWNVTALPTGIGPAVEGLLAVASVGTGFLRLSRRALNTLWAGSRPYTDGQHAGRMVCDVSIVAGQLYSEDRVLCHRWGGPVWVDPQIAIAHRGAYIYDASLASYLAGIQETG